MEYTTIEKINQYEGTTINPMKMPDNFYELYSVPSFESGHPEIIKGSDIGSSKITVAPNDILICKINPRINRIWVVGDESDYEKIASSEWIVVRTKDFNPEFLKWYFSSRRFINLMTSEITGIGGSLTRAQPKRVKQYPVPVVPIEQQNHIVSMLNKLKAITDNKKKEIDDLNMLIKSRFVEMFSEKGYSEKSLDELSVSGTQNGFYRKGSSINGTIPIVKMTQLFANESMENADDFDYVNLSKEELNRFRLTPNDILFGRRSLVPAGAGKCRRVGNINKDMVFESSLLRLTLKTNMVIPLYVQGYFDSPIGDMQMSRLRSGTTVVGIKGSDLKKLRIPVPPLDVQNKYEDLVEQVDKSKLAIQKSLDETQLLFDSLMQKYFG